MTRLRCAAVFLCATICVATTSARAGAQQRKEIIGAPAAGANPPLLSPAVRAGDLIFLSGQLASKPGARELAEGGIQGQTRQVLENLKSVLTTAGGTMDDVVKCTVFLADMADFAGMNQVYREFFPKDPPARSTVAVSALARPDAKVEIECIAVAAKH